MVFLRLFHHFAVSSKQVEQPRIFQLLTLYREALWSASALDHHLCEPTQILFLHQNLHLKSAATALSFYLSQQKIIKNFLNLNALVSLDFYKA